jgi:phosphopantothenoylcysteine decarboxylase/phosphopantothenate--cysteine ligase
MILKGKRILLGITGGIAAYKAVELLRYLIKEGAEVRVIMTNSAQKFVTPLTFETLSGYPVICELFHLNRESRIEHISLSEWANLMVIAPATANCIGKISSGIADDILTTTVMALKCPVLLCPSMNVNMYENMIFQENLRKLREYGYRIIEPAEGELACGQEGKGRLVDPIEIVEEIKFILEKKDLAGERILVTAGPTREALDPVRFITNSSSGKMGYAIAKVARRRGANVLLISGPTSLGDPRGIEVIRVQDAKGMLSAVLSNLEWSTILIKAAAVVDYKPKEFSKHKMKKKFDQELMLPLETTPDILMEVSKRKRDGQIIVGFAAETDDLLSNAMDKLKAKDLDLIVANDLTLPGAGFDVDTNVVKIIDRSGKIEELPLMTKEEVAERLLERIIEYRNSRVQPSCI